MMAVTTTAPTIALQSATATVSVPPIAVLASLAAGAFGMGFAEDQFFPNNGYL